MNNDLAKLPGLKESDLLKLGCCVICGKPQLGADVTFYKITISRAGFVRQAVERRAGLEMMLGSGPLARAMGPDDDLAKVIDGPHDVFVHESCAIEPHHLVALIPESKEPSEETTAAA